MVRVYKGGHPTYTVVFITDSGKRFYEKHFYEMSWNPFSPQGVNMYGGSADDGNLEGSPDEMVCELPDEVFLAIADRLAFDAEVEILTRKE